ncbi:hypothetical protein HanIR_Chr02g0094161 [Helianthus annuus]|nr:hypothetical protein HanIR_Chr02g0094161 [Helianthus annuus]
MFVESCQSALEHRKMAKKSQKPGEQTAKMKIMTIQRVSCDDSFKIRSSRER